MTIRGVWMDKNGPRPQDSETRSQNEGFRVMSNDAREEVLAFARALARQAVAEYLDGSSEQR